MDLNIDLNKVPDESRRVEENVTPADPQYEGTGSASIPPANVVDDEVTFLTATEWNAENVNIPRRRRSVRIPVDEISEADAEYPGVADEEPIPKLCLACLNRRIMMNRLTSDSVILLSDSYFPTARDARQFIPEARKLAPPSASSSISAATAAEEMAANSSGLICPICFNPLNEPSSTTCGHMFCSGCLEQAMRKKKICPTCRKKLTKRNVHKIFPNFK